MPEESDLKWTSIKITFEFATLIDEILDDTKLGFESRAEVVKTAVREYYDRYIERKIKKEELGKD
jgi:metal-responsive CopG/Arc/MetJ family transcriptional regulator